MYVYYYMYVSVWGVFLSPCILLFVRFGKRYELPLLIQSIVMIITMLGMMHLCIAVLHDKGAIVTRRLLGTFSHRVHQLKYY